MNLLIDNYDSFSYNLVQLVGSLDPDIRVVRNDEVTVDEILRMHPDHLILSPGPGRPAESGICEQAVQELAGVMPILGVCLGHQAICEAYGAVICRAEQLMHGKQSAIHIANGSAVFRGLSPLIRGARYHSLLARRDSLPDELLVTAEDDAGEVMAVKHRDHEIYGLQFHPESILTPDGREILKNFLSLTEKGGSRHD